MIYAESIALANAIPHIVWSTDGAGSFDYANERWVEYTRQSATAVGGAPWEESVHPDDLARIAAAWAESVETGNSFECELRLRRWDGVYRWHLSRGEPARDSAGTIVRWFGTCTDIDDLKHLEHQFRQAQKMEAVGRLAGGVAHDFNNLLTVIHGHTEFLSRGLPANGQLREDVDQIMKAANRAADLTRQLLAFSRQQVLDKRLIDANALMRELEKMLSRLIGEDINLDLSLDANAPMVLADPGQVEHAVMNLVVNARDAMPQGGDLRLSTRHVVLAPGDARRHEVAPGEYVAIGVADTGSGIAPEVLIQIFEPFFTTKQAGRGTGLGLATVYGIARQSDGFVDVSSTAGSGSLFTLHLPAATVTDTGSAMKRTTPPGRRDELILVVEDQDAVRAVTRRILVTNGYRVIEAQNGVDALALLNDKETRVDLVLTDAVMPHMSGPDLVRTLRATQPRLPVVIVSGYTAHALVTYGTAELNVPFLHKPFRGEDLLSVIRRTIDELEQQPADSPLEPTASS